MSHKTTTPRIRLNGYINQPGSVTITISFSLYQLLWAETEKVGCGKIVFEGTNGATSDLRTCDYGEG